MATQIKQFDLSGKESGSVQVPGDLLEITPRRDVLHAVVVWQQNKKRQWNANTKTRSEVAGGGAKPWRQKGTGRARAGTRNSPIWRGGGTIFGPRTKRGVAPSLPKKVRKLGLRMALADRLNNDALKIVVGGDFEQTGAQQAKSVVRAVGGRNTLVVVGDGRSQKGKASIAERCYRNLNNVRVLQAEGLNVYDVLKADSVLITDGAVNSVFARLGNQGAAA